ncbi:hypothetical protein M422DRAFT_239792 [Sphaerobolus stellatus SS14]|nr:hypothetical protein M422DRAFT_239792 [Sphaerobolus stellatus SS14]
MLRDSDLLGETLENGKQSKIYNLLEDLDKATPSDKSADRAEYVWDHLYPSNKWWDRDILNLSNVWDYFEEMLPFWKQQFIRNDTGEWILTGKFVKPGDVSESPSPSSNILPYEGPHPSSVSEETETPYQYAPSTTPFLPQESSIRGTYDFPDPMPQAGPSGSYRLHHSPRILEEEISHIPILIRSPAIFLKLTVSIHSNTTRYHIFKTYSIFIRILPILPKHGLIIQQSPPTSTVLEALRYPFAFFTLDSFGAAIVGIPT